MASFLRCSNEAGRHRKETASKRRKGNARFLYESVFCDKHLKKRCLFLPGQASSVKSCLFDWRLTWRSPGTWRRLLYGNNGVLAHVARHEVVEFRAECSGGGSIEHAPADARIVAVMVFIIEACVPVTSHADAVKSNTVVFVLEAPTGATDRGKEKVGAMKFGLRAIRVACERHGNVIWP